MADSYHHWFADSAKAPNPTGVTPPFVRWPIASTRRRLTAAG